MEKEFIKAKPVVLKLLDHGYQAVFVGGSVRDRIMNKVHGTNYSVHDIDIATDATPEEVLQLFPHSIDTNGVKHGTVVAVHEGENYEITTFRKESDYSDGRRPDTVEFTHDLQEDLNRRDFTINALAMTFDGQIIDYHDGIRDIHDLKLRCVGNANHRFQEDSLRILRMFRFQATHQLTPGQREIIAATHNSSLLSNLSGERVHVEITKLMLSDWHEPFQIMISNDIFNSLPYLKDIKLADVKPYCEQK